MSAPAASLRESLGTLPRAVWILFFGIFLNKFGTFVVPFLSIIMIQRGFTAGDAGLAISALGAGHLAAAIVGGQLADAIGRRLTIVCSMFSVAVAMLCLSQARELSEIVIWAGLAGLTGELYRPASSALLVDLTPPEHRVPAFAAYRIAFNAGWAFGPVVGGLLASQSYFWLFAGDAATSVLFGLVAWLALPKGRQARAPHDPRHGFWPLVKSDHPFHQVLLSSLFVGLVYVQLIGAFGLAIHARGLSNTAYGLLMSINGTLVVLFELPLTTLTRRFPARRVMAAGYVLIGAGFGSVAWVETAGGFALACGLFTLGEMIAMPVSTAYVADLTPEHLRGRYMGVYGLTWALALTAGPAAGAFLFAWNPALLWGTSLGMGCLAAAIISLPSGKKGGRAAVAP